MENDYETHFRAMLCVYFDEWSAGEAVADSRSWHYSAGFNLRQKFPVIHSYIGIATKNGNTQMTIYYVLDVFGVANS